ncbi:MAG: phage/plasmid primase, P4 family [Candidatus Omnitrophota bacterium]|jgi:putative DNA primase/helicase
MANIDDAKKFFTDTDNIAQGLLIAQFIFDPNETTQEGIEAFLANPEAKLSTAGGCYTLKYWRDDFYTWAEGCWKKISDSELQRIVVAHLQKLNETADCEQKINIGTYKVRDIILCLKGTVGVTESVEANTWVDGREKIFYTLSLRNGLLLLDKRQKDRPSLQPHTPKFFNLTKLSYDYDAKAECPAFQDFLFDIFQENTEYCNLIMQWCGYLLRPDLNEQKFMLFVGEGANGKSVLSDVIIALVGAANCSHLPLNRFGDKFSLNAMVGKLLNTSIESSSIIEEEAETLLKSVVAGDLLTIDRKFKESIEVKPTAKILIATNALPRFNDHSQGTWRRLLLVPFDKVIPESEQKKNLVDMLKKELSGILNFAIAGLNSLNTNGGFTIPKDMKEQVEQYHRDSDPARCFLFENYQADPNSKIRCSEIYKTYTAYCIENGYKSMNVRTFGQQVKRCFQQVERIRPGSGNSRDWFYQGITSQAS